MPAATSLSFEAPELRSGDSEAAKTTDDPSTEGPDASTTPTQESPSTPLFHDPRDAESSGGKRIAPLDLWRVHLEQCPDCGHVHGQSRGVVGPNPSRPERHIYEYTQGVPEDLCCALCGEVFQNPSLVPCGHHFCSACVRTLLHRGSGRAACPLDGQAVTRFAVMPAEAQLLARVGELRVRCPICSEEIRKADLQLHLQDPVNMIEHADAYQAILRPFYMSCPLSNFTVGELNGTSALIRFYRKLGDATLRRFVLTTEDFIVLPDPKMGFQPHTEEDIQVLQKRGGYFNAWWVHPSFRREVWWKQHEAESASSSTSPSANGAGRPTDAASRAFREAVRKRDEATSLLRGLDCSSEPWHESSFVHTWSGVRKPKDPRYICCLRDLRAE
ncbi:unnamed protein product, partial [Polarella glacialis]